MDAKLMKLMAAKKNAKPMSDVEKQAKKSVLGELSSVAKEAMGSKLNGMKKVTVASDSPEGLKKGLSMAEKLAGKEEGMEHEGMESPEMEAGEQEEKSEMVAEMCAECSAEELQQVIAKLQEMLSAKSESSLEA